MKHLPFPALLLALGLTGCTVHETPPTEFLTSTGTDTSSKLPRLPFDHSWRDPSVDFRTYRNIVIPPVTTAYLHKGGATKRQGEELARRFTAALKLAFSSPVCGYYITDKRSKPDTLILEVALIEADEVGTERQAVAFEARVTDAESGKTLASAADRRNVEEFDEWSDELMQATNKELFPKVRKHSPSPF